MAHDACTYKGASCAGRRATATLCETAALSNGVSLKSSKSGKSGTEMDARAGCVSWETAETSDPREHSAMHWSEHPQVVAADGATTDAVAGVIVIAAASSALQSEWRVSRVSSVSGFSEDGRLRRSRQRSRGRSSTAHGDDAWRSTRKSKKLPFSDACSAGAARSTGWLRIASSSSSSSRGGSGCGTCRRL